MSNANSAPKGIQVLERLIVPINQFIHGIGMISLFAMMVLTTGDVLGRHLIKPIPGAYELTEIGMVVVVFFSLGYTQIRKGHVNIDLIVSRFSARVQGIFDSLTYLITLLLLILLTRQLWAHADRLLSTHSVTGVLAIPLYPIAIIAAIGCLIYILAVMLDLLVAVIKVVSKK